MVGKKILICVPPASLLVAGTQLFGEQDDKLGGGLTAIIILIAGPFIIGAIENALKR